MKCDTCGKGLDDGPLYRVNEKGVAGIWRHRGCGEPTETMQDQDLVDLTETIHDGLNKDE